MKVFRARRLREEKRRMKCRGYRDLKSSMKFDVASAVPGPKDLLGRKAGAKRRQGMSPDSFTSEKAVLFLPFSVLLK
jgi:hypothetical protein